MEQFIIEIQNIAQVASEMAESNGLLDFITSARESKKCNIYYI